VNIVVLLSGTGFHVRDLPKKTIKEQVITNQWSFAVQMFYHPMMFAIRASIIVFLWRMKDKRRRIRYSLHVVCKCTPLLLYDFILTTIQSGSTSSMVSAPLLETSYSAHPCNMHGTSPPWIPKTPTAISSKAANVLILELSSSHPAHSVSSWISSSSQSRLSWSGTSKWTAKRRCSLSALCP
jgi:hypothetical protein